MILDESIQSFLIEKGFRLDIVNYILLLIDLIIFWVLSVIANWVTKKIIIRGIQSVIEKTKNNWDDIFLKKKVFHSLSRLVPLLILNYLSSNIFSNFEFIIPFISIAIAVLMIIVVTSVITKALKALEEVSLHSEYFKDKPIGTYIQLTNIITYVIASILIFSAIIEKDPIALFGALGALTAVIMLVFKDTILGLVASIQLSSNDMVKIGDWVSMPKYGADGDVLKITLNTVKIQNWDKTISTVPTYAFISDSFKNWRGMSDAKARRIKRSFNIDMNSIKFCTEERLKFYKKFELLKDYIDSKQAEIQTYNGEHNHDKSFLINGRNLTNIGLFREYAKEYLMNNKDVRKDLTQMVRQLAPTENGLPIEIYCFSSNINWVEYETIIANIFDHLISSIPDFDLEIFQSPTGKFGGE